MHQSDLFVSFAHHGGKTHAFATHSLLHHSRLSIYHLNTIFSIPLSCVHPFFPTPSILSHSPRFRLHPTQSLPPISKFSPLSRPSSQPSHRHSPTLLQPPTPHTNTIDASPLTATRAVISAAYNLRHRLACYRRSYRRHHRLESYHHSCRRQTTLNLTAALAVGTTAFPLPPHLPEYNLQCRLSRTYRDRRR